MSDLYYGFASDNTAGVCPEALQAIIEHNCGYAPGYGADQVTMEAADAVRRLLDADAEVRFVASGTAANALICATLVRPFEAMLAHHHAHICTDEAGAPGFFGQGIGLIRLPGESGKINHEALRVALDQPESAKDQSPSALSITNVTEYGTLYTEDEVGRLTELAKEKGCTVHLDGARLANAVAAGFDPTKLKDLNIDMLVLGGTKAGAPLSEALVIFNKRLTHRFDARLKQAGQMPSKGRFIASPWLGLLSDGCWSRRASHANAMATRLAEMIPFPLAHPVHANAVFVTMDDATQRRLLAAGLLAYRFHDGSVRFMCSWATTAELVEKAVSIICSVI